jgi:hypothetical protein
MGTDQTGSNLYPNAFIILAGGTNQNNFEVWPLTDIGGSGAIIGAVNGWATSTWYNIALVGNTGQGQALTMYVDGVSTLTGNSDNVGTFDPDLTEWGNDTNADANLTARFQYAKIWNAQLSADEVRSEMRRFVPIRFANIWGAWEFFDDTAGSLADRTGQGRTAAETGTLTVEDGPPIPYGHGRGFRRPQSFTPAPTPRPWLRTSGGLMLRVDGSGRLLRAA